MKIEPRRSAPSKARQNLFLIPLVLGLLSSLSAPAAEPSARVVVGDPAKPAQLPTALLDAYAKGSRDIAIAPGTYNLPATGKGTIELTAWKDASIHAEGVTIVFEELAHRPLRLSQCERVTVSGATLRFAKPAFTQGKIKAMGKDAKGAFLDWQVNAGYPAELDPSKTTFDVVDQSTRLLRVGTGDFGCASHETLGHGLFRLRQVNGRLGSAKVNDWIFTRFPNGSSLVHLEGCNHCTMRKVTLQNAGFAAFFDTGGEGGNVYQECRVEPGPKPAGATEEQLVGCGADGFHSAGTKVGPTIDRCAWIGLLHDDCIAIHGSLQEVLRAEKNKLILVKGNRASFAVGDPVRISNDKGYYGEFTCTGVRTVREEVEYQELHLRGHDGRPPVLLTVKKMAGEGFVLNDLVKISGKNGLYGNYKCKEIRPFQRSDEYLELTLDRESAAPANAKASNPRRNGAGFKILNCTLGNCRSRGILVKADNGLIEGCTISGCGMSAISIGPEYYWNEADYSRHVTVRGNTLRNNVLNGSDAGVIFVHGDGAVGNADINISNNILDKNYGQKNVHVEDTDGVSITDNRFIASPVPLPNGARILMEFKSTKNITLQGNTVENPAAADKLVALGKNVEAVRGNDPSGIAVKN